MGIKICNFFFAAIVRFVIYLLTFYPQKHLLGKTEKKLRGSFEGPLSCLFGTGETQLY